jgi:hypothetical protein
MLTRAPILLLSLTACATGVGQSAPTTDAPSAADPADAASTADAPRGTPDAPPQIAPDASTSPCAFSGVLATWDFTGQPGTQASTAAKSSAPGVTAGAIIRQPTLTATSGSGSINSSNWPTATALDATKYYTLTLTAPAGCTVAVTSIAIDAKSSSTGPASAVMATSADGFAQTTAISTTASSTPSVSASGQTLELRIYGFHATGTGGTMRVSNTLTVTGHLQ